MAMEFCHLAAIVAALRHSDHYIILYKLDCINRLLYIDPGYQP